MEDVSELFAKLSSARQRRDVVCAPPEAIKSLVLKVVEQLHALDTANLNALVPNEYSRNNREVTRMRDALVAKSDASDALVAVLDLWKSGILVMDEVDVLLHPLRSELNFPIGAKYPIDLAGNRWDLPIHLCDAFFVAQQAGRASQLGDHAAAADAVASSAFDAATMASAAAQLTGYTAQSVLQELTDCVRYVSLPLPLPPSPSLSLSLCLPSTNSPTTLARGTPRTPSSASHTWSSLTPPSTRPGSGETKSIGRPLFPPPSPSLFACLFVCLFVCCLPLPLN